MVKTSGVELVCGCCGKPKGRYAKEWLACTKCETVVCFKCCHRGVTTFESSRTLCHNCWQEEWNKHWDEQELARKATLHKCYGCNGVFVEDNMNTTTEPGLCKTCYSIVNNYKVAEKRVSKKRNAKPGLVECVWGVHKVTEDGGDGYAYRDPGLNLQLGDIVMLPPTWLDRDVKGKYDEHEATVICTYSDYSKSVDTVRRLVKHGGIVLNS